MAKAESRLMWKKNYKHMAESNIYSGGYKVAQKAGTWIALVFKKFSLQI